VPTPRSVTSGPATSSGLVVQRGGSAVAGVLVFRLVTYWLPVIPGAAVTFANAP
jgi:uncharacterized membrane protein YbhN (UPF0104 family)